MPYANVIWDFTSADASSGRSCFDWTRRTLTAMQMRLKSSSRSFKYRRKIGKRAVEILRNLAVHRIEPADERELLRKRTY